MHLYQSLNRHFSLFGHKCFQTRTFLWPLTIHRRLLEIRKKYFGKNECCTKTLSAQDLELVPWTCFFKSLRLWSEGQQVNNFLCQDSNWKRRCWGVRKLHKYIQLSIISALEIITNNDQKYILINIKSDEQYKTWYNSYE